MNDGSTDSSWNIIKDKTIVYPKTICAINLMNNHGQHLANYCGFNNSSGDYVITMDDDMQNPVNEIKKLILKSKEGYDLVIGEYEEKKHSLTRKFGSKIIRYLNSKIFKIPENLSLSNFRIIQKNLVEIICRLNINYPYLPGLLVHYSSSVANVKVTHKERRFGKSNYDFFKITKLIFEILFNFSIFPLRLMTIFGLLISLFCFFLGSFFLLKALIYGVEVEGWTTIIVMLSFMTALILMVLFMLGEYIIRIIKNLTINEKYFIKNIIKDDKHRSHK